jgi:UDP-glucose 4-epimerase
LGSEGFVGKNLVDGLDKKNEVYSADIFEQSSHKNYLQFDIQKIESVEKILQNIDVVIDLVAHSLVSSIEGPIKNAEVNIIGLLNVLEACRKNNVKKIIFTSASSMIGEPEMPSVSETHIPRPKTAYGITKLASEHYLRLYNELYGLKFVIFRFFNIYGPHQKNGLIPSLYSQVVNNKPLSVFGKGDQVRDYVFIKDIIPFFEKAASLEFNNNSTFNMGTGKGTSIKQIIDLIADVLNVQPLIEYKPLRPGEIGNFVADTNLLKSTFGSIPQTSIKDGIQKTISWLKTN